MKKLIATLLVGLSLLMAVSAAQAHSSGHGGIHGSISIRIPIGHHGYAVLSTAAPHYFGSYGHRGYNHSYHRAYGVDHGYGHRSSRHRSRHHGHHRGGHDGGHSQRDRRHH